MLIDPLGDEPIVISGSANFSETSTVSNDENMLIIRGNKRVADIYLGEFMRLWHHYRFRFIVNAKAEENNAGTDRAYEPNYLCEDASN
jgi:phosphatidylserine/phosphatidylglycerophosphate/cardiolipin synthase-like enzyme